MSQTPSVGRIVHYQSYGTPGGEFTMECRAAIVTEVFREYVVSVAVLNPTGVVFAQRIQVDDPGHNGGTWHWPERVEAGA